MSGWGQQSKICDRSHWRQVGWREGNQLAMTSCGDGGSAVRSPRWQCIEPDQLYAWKLRRGGHVWVGDGSHERSL